MNIEYRVCKAVPGSHYWLTVQPGDDEIRREPSKHELHRRAGRHFGLFNDPFNDPGYGYEL